MSRDTTTSFFYIEPPYYNSDCGHYDGYTIDDFRQLLTALTKLEGKFLLSSYPSPILTEFTKANNWYQISREMNVSVNKGVSGKKKVEVFTANYKL
jgi:DNA adenine methylase